jgi:hypothetical protein
MRFKYLVVLLFFCLSVAYGQQRSVRIYNVDVKVLHDSLLSDLARYRKTQRLPVFDGDKILEHAAVLQAKYCLKNKTTSNVQPKESLKTVKERTKKFLSTHEHVDELIVKLEMKYIRPASYNELTQLVIRMCQKNSDYAAIINNKSNRLVGVSVVKDDHSIYVVLVLGSAVIESSEKKIINKTYHIQPTTYDKKGMCKACSKALAFMSKDEFYDLVVDKEQIFLIFSSKALFIRLISQKNDGATIDIIRKAQFPCGYNNIEPKNGVNYGHLLPPVSKKEMLKGATQNDKGYIFVPMGKVPKEWIGTTYELNLLWLSDGFLCQYSTFFQVPFEGWKNLPLAYDFGLEGKSISDEIVIKKQMNFSIPFAQGKSTFDTKDLKPLVDSLQLVQYQIKSLAITAYSSVEGSKNINTDLQQKRAQSISKSIQSYQSSIPFTTQITTAENWAAFYQDIQRTQKSFLAQKTQNEIVTYLNANSSGWLDSLLSPHRKALVTVDLERKQQYKTLNTQTLAALLAQLKNESALQKMNLVTEVYQANNKVLTNYLWSQIQRDENWPIEAKTKVLVHLYQQDSTSKDLVLGSLQKLQLSTSPSPMLDYNLYLIQLKEWQKKIGKKAVPVGLKEKLWGSTKIEPSKLRKLQINYLMLEAHEHQLDQKYDLKNKTMVQLLKIIKQVNFNDEEKLELAKYLVQHQQLAEASQLIAVRAKESDVLQDLLFLYINLSIIDEKTTQKTDFRAILANAEAINKDRFCKIFDSALAGGITFQLLRDKYLKRSYCDICE